MAVTTFACTWPEQALDMRVALGAADTAADDAAEAASEAASEAPPGEAAAAAAWAVVDAVSAAHAAFAIADAGAAYICGFATRAALGAAHAYATAVGDDITSHAGYSAISADVNKLADGAGRIAVVTSPLWPDEDGPPGPIVAMWSRLQRRLMEDEAAVDGWQVWIEWYEARMRGVPPIPDLERAIARIDQRIWDDGPATANAEVARLVELHRGGAEPLEETEAPDPPEFDPQVLFTEAPDPPEFDPRVLFDADGRSYVGIGDHWLPRQDHGDGDVAGSSDDTSPSSPETPADAEPVESAETRPPSPATPQNNRTIAFFSYTRNDDRLTGNLLSKIRRELEDALTLRHGARLEVFQDVSDIVGGDLWREKLEQALEEAAIFVPIITPSFFNSEHCREELRRFLKRSDASTTILPIHFIDTDFTQNDARDALKERIEERQWLDWRSHNRRRSVTQSLRNEIHDAARLILQRWRSA